MSFARLITLLSIVVMFCSASVYARKIPEPQDIGHVRLNQFTKAAGVESVDFEHWRHRTRFTCRLCHVDIGFAMQKEATGINADLNMQGYYCGACHNGNRVFDGRELFGSCLEDVNPSEIKRCAHCHARKSREQREKEFNEFAGNLPRLSARNLIDWEKAEAKGFIQLVDFLEGVSYERDKMKVQKDFAIEVTTWASDVIFSHKKHAIWNGCELCHPLIFPSSKQGTVNYTMFEIARGEYCGVCHVSVAFPVWLCHKCHKSPVR